MTRAGTSTARQDTGAAAQAPHGTAESLHLLTMQDIVRRGRWIAQDVNAAGFGLFFAGPSPERARLVPCFDSAHPAVDAMSKAVSGAGGEHAARHALTSTVPLWWADDGVPGSDAAFRDLPWAERTAALVPGTNGIALPVQAERGLCGLAVYVGPALALGGDALYDIHARCFALFSALARIRPGNVGRLMSKRELECLKLTANGYTSEEIARLLKLSVHTANQYLAQSAQKLNAVSRTQAVAKALRLGLIE